MTDTHAPPITHAPSAPAPSRRRWISVLAAFALAAAGIVAAVLLWPDSGRSAPFGDLTWSEVTGVPEDRFYAVTATEGSTSGRHPMGVSGSCTRASGRPSNPMRW